MWPTVTIYTASGSLTLLNAIFNGVAAICNQSDYIWGFAVMAALFHLAAAPMITAIQGPSGHGSSVLTKSVTSPFVALLLAFLLTTPSLKGKVQIESTINGTTTVVNNVPVAISIMPAAASLLSNSLGTMVSTAYQTVGTNYSAISSQMNGFVNPLKALLGARYVVMGLGQIDSEVKTVVDACLGSDSGIDYAAVNQAVMNAGNTTGASAAQTIPINGVSGTSLGALLYQAAQSQNGIVNNLDPNQTIIYSCPDAVTKVATDISNDLQTQDFSRAVQIGVNSMDQPLASADFSLSNLQTQYNALINADSVNTANVYGAVQAQQELYNLMFSALVNTDLSCLQANGSDKTTCYATLEQVQATERNNIQAAAAETPMLKYAGNLANYMLALIIGLGPVLVLFMMLAGVDAGKSAKMAVHIMVWPLLVMNVGAELINGMICIQLSDFYVTLRQGGIISQAETYTAYQELSMQIGAASNLMASLPVLMSMIFGLSATAGLVSVANKNTPDFGKSAADLAPAPSVTKGHSVASYDMMPDGSAHLSTTGSQRAIASTAELSSMQTAGSAVSSARTAQHTISEAQSNLASWRKAFISGNYSGVGVDSSVGNEVRQAFNDIQRVSTNTQTGNQQQSSQSNTNQSNVSVGVEGHAGLTGAGVKIRGSASTSTGATDSLQTTQNSGRTQSYDQSRDLSKAIAKVMASHNTSRSGHDNRHELQRSMDIQSSYQDLMSKSDTNTSSAEAAVRDSQSFIEMQQHIDPTIVTTQLATNRQFSAYETTAGMRFDADPSNHQYLTQAEQQINDGETDTILGNDRAKHVMARMRAATLLANDQDAPSDKRLAALEYLVGGANAMFGRQVLGDRRPDAVETFKDLHDPKNQTSVSKNPSQQGHQRKHHHHDHVGTRGHQTHLIPHVGDNQSVLDSAKSVLAKDASGITAHEVQQEDAANDAGLGQAGHGTIIRTAENVKDNIHHGGTGPNNFGKK